MNKQEIIDMAREVELLVDDEGVLNSSDIIVINIKELQRFAKLVAVKEREACAKVCDSRYMGDNTREDMEARRCAAAIRARNKEGNEQ